MKPISILILLMGFLSEECWAIDPTGDSVTNGRQRGSASAPLAPNPGHTALLTQVPLASQTPLNYFVRYGPFFNGSNATLRIRLQHVGGSPEHDVIGIIGDYPVAAHQDSIEYEVPPQTSYSFAAKDYAMISAWANHSGMTNAEVGLPTEENFRSPTGTFVRCFDVVRLYSQVRYSVYHYAIGSMSDGSVRLDSESARVPNTTTGPKPAESVTCETRLDD